MKFDLHTPETAPEKSKAMLTDALESWGMIPNLHAVMAESPALLEGYRNLHELFQTTSFNADELTVVWQTINVEHNCHYCVPGHTAIAKMMNVSDDIIEALRNETTIPDEKLQTLHVTTLALVRNRGHLTEQELADFFDAGYEKQQLLEIILGISQKVMSNYVNHLADTPVDAAFQAHLWKKKSAL